MRVHVVSDVHGNVEALARAAEGADALVILGDLLDFVDYNDYSAGILGAVFGAGVVRRFAELRSGGAPGEAGVFARQMWDDLDDPAAVVIDAVREQYRRIFAVLPDPTYAVPGNVDLPQLWPEFAHDGVRVLDGEATDIGGLRFGFVGGALLPDGVSPRRADPWMSYLRTSQDYATAVGGLPEVDVLCSHVPPAVPELVYDVVARNPEIGSEALLDVIRRNQPWAALFGHVHHPLAPRVRLGRTECVNVGHFQRIAVPYMLRW
ncbi:MAG: metallophosphoesterase [Pseudonocardiaceae bacterium]|nr:metallophosphoesterase [Pseudonocardiaceae bacterium]